MKTRSLLLHRLSLFTLALVFMATPESASGQGRWQMIDTAEDPLHRHESAYVKAGNRFYAIGGRGERPVEIFDPATGTWTKGAAAPLEMHHFQAVEFDGKIYVLGALTGSWPREQPIPNVYIYDPATGAWTKGPEIPADRRRGAAGVVVHDGLIYVVAGIQNGHTDGHVAWLDAFNPRTGEWKRLADAPRPRDHFQAGVLDGKIYAAGGRLSSAEPGKGFTQTTPEVDVYDIASGTWSTLPPSANIPTPRAGSTTIVYDGKLVVLGGESGSQEPAHAEVEVFDPATGRWQAWQPMNQGRHGTQAIVHDGRIYVVAGSKMRGADEINTHEVYSPR